MDNTSLLIDLSLAMNQIGCHIHQIQYSIDGLVPVPEQIILILHGPEINHTINSVDSALYGLVIIECA
jgi:hypothetical protein